MDRDFMCFFYRNILPERTEVAVQGNIPYHKAEEMVREWRMNCTHASTTRHGTCI